MCEPLEWAEHDKSLSLKGYIEEEILKEKNSLLLIMKERQDRIEQHSGESQFSPPRIFFDDEIEHEIFLSDLGIVNHHRKQNGQWLVSKPEPVSPNLSLCSNHPNSPIPKNKNKCFADDDIFPYDRGSTNASEEKII